MSTSGSEEQFFESGGRRFGHIIDSRTGWPAEKVSSVTVVADIAARSDALATAFFVGGRALAERYCEKHRDVLAIMLEAASPDPIMIGHKRCEMSCFKSYLTQRRNGATKALGAPKFRCAVAPLRENIPVLLAMIEESKNLVTTPQSIALFVLRTLIGWHFLYEAYFKIMSPAWSRGGGPLTPWTSAGYLQGASGPLGGIFHRLVNAGWTVWLDRSVKVTLLLIGLSLLLGLFTRVGLWLALAMLTYVLSALRADARYTATK